MLFASLNGFIQENGKPNQKRFAWLIEAFMDEALDDMSENPQDVAEVLDIIGRMMHWIATGEGAGPEIENMNDFFGKMKALPVGTST